MGQNLKENETPAETEQETVDLDLNDPELEKAVNQIQASFRGYKTKQNLKENETPGNEEIVDIDLNDPELEKAATQIQGALIAKTAALGDKAPPENQRQRLPAPSSMTPYRRRTALSHIITISTLQKGRPCTSYTSEYHPNDTWCLSLYIYVYHINHEYPIINDELCSRARRSSTPVLQTKDLEVSVSDNTNTLEVGHAGDSDWSNVSSRDASPSPDQSAFSAPVNITELNTAATKIQSIFRGYRTRQQIKKHRTNGPAHSRNKSKRRGSGNKDNEDAAATKIQAAFRGFKTRKHMKNTSKPSYRSLPRGMQQRRDRLEAAQREARRGSLTRDVLMASVLEERMQHREVPPEDPALTKAVVTLQAGVRGYLTRKHMAEKRAASDSSNADQINAEAAATKIQAGFRGYKTRKMLRERAQASLDLSDPAVIQAAVRIQAALRGHLARKELRGAS
ncbi:uncharacterized protein [Penaeus vannamei]|uniref:uncharacterized protein n=1 Tax=Penaeus vannamei TaxID=6689 RepID=UPI00387F7D6C